MTTQRQKGATVAEKTKIEWCDATFNPWKGCTKWGPDCANCYAALFSLRTGGPEYAKGVPRQRCIGFESSAMRLASKAARLGKRLKVFPSLCDVFDAEVPPEWHADFWRVVDATRDRLDWLILTKRTENIAGMLPEGWGRGWDGVWLGMSAGDQKTFDLRAPAFLSAHAFLRFLSYEPAFGPVDIGLQSATCGCCERWPSRWAELHGDVYADHWLRAIHPEKRSMVARAGVHRLESNAHGALSARTDGGLLGIMPAEMTVLPGFDWVIVGGESGPGARPFDPLWAHSVVGQCAAAGVPAFIKQMGSRPVGMSLRDKKGGDMSEWPEDLRVRQWPAMLMDRAGGDRG